MFLASYKLNCFKNAHTAFSVQMTVCRAWPILEIACTLTPASGEALQGITSHLTRIRKWGKPRQGLFSSYIPKSILCLSMLNEENTKSYLLRLFIFKTITRISLIIMFLKKCQYTTKNIKKVLLLFSYLTELWKQFLYHNVP